MQNKNPGDIISGALDVRDRIRTHDLLVRSYLRMDAGTLP